MPTELTRTEWRNNNERVNYPFSDRASLVNEDGVVIDRDLFDDARLYPIGGAAGIFLNRITVEETSATFAIGDPSSGELAYGLFDGDAPKDEVALFDAAGRPAGVFVSSVERLSALVGALGPGDFLFETDQTEFAASVAIPLPQAGLRGFELDDGNVITGDVYLVGVDGVVLSFEGGAIRIDVLGDPYALLKACEEEGSPLPAFCGLRSINGIRPDDNGDFKIAPGGNVAEDTVLRVTVEAGRISISQVCTAELGLTN